MKTILKLILLSSLLVVFQACSQKIQIKALKAPKVLTSDVKYISIDKFRNDTVSQASQIHTALANVTIDGKRYFHVTNRQNINKILEEQKLKDSGLVDLVDDEEIKGLQDAKTLLSGEVLINDISSSRFYTVRTDYKTCIATYKKKGKTYCKKYRKYKVPCRRNYYTLKTKINLIQISTGISYFEKDYSSKTNYSHCIDDRKTLPSKQYVNTKLANNIAYYLVKDIAPSYVYFNVILLDSLDIDLSSKQEDMFDLALKLIEQKRISKANQLLSNLNKQIHNNSYVVLYDLAITTEALGDLQKAYSLLKNAEDIAISKNKLIKEISTSIQRVKNNIDQINKVQKNSLK